MSGFKTIGFYFGCFLLALVMLFVGLDKAKLFYTLGGVLKEQGVVIEPKIVDSGAFGFELLESKVYYNNSEVASVESVQLSLGGFSLKHLAFENMLKQLIGFGVEEVSYGIFSPFTVKFKGEMGEGEAYYNVEAASFKVRIKPSSMLNESKYRAYFSEVAGELVYEYRL